MDSKELKEIIEKHHKWLLDEKGGERADLSYADLSYADLRSADLSYADLRYVDLRSADLSYADLRSADLSYADLRYVDLRSADLSSANLSSANLSSADLRSADLRSASLWETNGNRKELKSVFVSDVYPITYTAEIMQIGCERRAIDDWWGFDDQAILEMDGKTALKFWRENKEFLQLTIKQFPATPIELKREE